MSVESASSVPFATASFISPQAQYRIEKENDDHAEDRKTEFSRTNEDFAEKPVNDYLNIRIDEVSTTAYYTAKQKFYMWWLVGFTYKNVKN